MYIQTDRLIIRDLTENDAESLLEIKYDEQVLKYDPTFIKRDAKVTDVNEYINSIETPKDCAICLKESDVVIGVITVSNLDYLYELQIGWMMNGKYTGNGYASEAGAAVSDYLLDTLSLDYISVTMDTDNPASFKTAQKSGFKLFEKRYPYDYFYSECDVENFDEVNKYFKYLQSRGYCDGYYYFRKFNKNSKIKSQFYGDTEYEGRFS